MADRGSSSLFLMPKRKFEEDVDDEATIHKKKPLLNEEGEEDEDGIIWPVGWVVHSGDSDDEAAEKVSPEFWNAYLKEISESEGFYIKHFPGSCTNTSILPIPIRTAGTYNEMVSKVTIKAIHMYNVEKDEKYEFVDLVRANWTVGGEILFYITFRMKNTKHGDQANPEIFQTKVFRSITDKDDVEVVLFRPQPQKA